jgi:hypothetical protein
MFFRLSQADEAQVIPTLRVSQMHDNAVEKPQRIDALFVVTCSIIFPTDHRAGKDRLAADKIKAMLFEIELPLGFVVSHHEPNCTHNLIRKQSFAAQDLHTI